MQASSTQSSQPKVQAQTAVKPATVAATSSSVDAPAKKAVTESQQSRLPATELSQQPAYQFYHVMLVVFPIFIVDLRMLVLPQPIQIYPLFTLQHCIATGEVLLGHWSAFTHGYSAPTAAATNITINNNIVVGNNNQIVQQTDQRSSFHFGANATSVEPAQRQQQEQEVGGPKPTSR